MKWFNGKIISNKNLSLFGGFVLVLLLACLFNVPKKQKKYLAAKQYTHGLQITQRVFNKIVQPTSSKKYVAKVPLKKIIKQRTVKPVKFDSKKVARYHFVKKNVKAKSRRLARVEKSKLSADAELSMDSWNNQHEQIETLVEKVSDDPVGASRFQDKRLAEELAAAGI